MIAREGVALIIGGVLATALLALAAARWSSLLLLLVAAVVGVLTLFTVYFFRDPDRQIVGERGVLLAPADGRVLAVEKVTDPFVGGDAIKISIFLSLFDVHINRVPTDGVVTSVEYHKGRFLPAYRPEASCDNQCCEIGLVAGAGQRLVVRQLTGAIARRIVCRLRQGDRVVAGQRFGMIRFGSRTELIVPADSEIDVTPGDHVRAGETLIGRLFYARQQPPLAPDRRPGTRS